MKVYERNCSGLFGRFMAWLEWGGVCLVLPWACYVLYWAWGTKGDLKDVPDWIRRHECEGHGGQAKRYGFLGWWRRYITGFLKHGYKNHPMELEAQAIAASEVSQ